MSPRIVSTVLLLTAVTAPAQSSAKKKDGSPPLTPFKSEKFLFEIGKPEGWSWVRTGSLDHHLIGMEKEFPGFGTVFVLVRAMRSDEKIEDFVSKKLEIAIDQGWQKPKKTKERVPFAGVDALRMTFEAAKDFRPGYGIFFVFKTKEKVLFELREEYPTLPPEHVRKEMDLIRASTRCGSVVKKK